MSNILAFVPLQIAVVAALVLASVLVKRAQLIFQLRRIRGSLINRISGIPHILDLYSQDYPRRYEQYSLKYGQLAVVSPTVVLTSSPDLWTRVNTHPGYTRSKWFYRNIRYDWRRDNLLTEVDTERHDERRKQMIRGYSGSDNLMLAEDIDGCVRKLIRLVRTKYASTGKPMDLAEKLHFFTLDTISTIGFGKCFDLMDTDADPNDYLHATRMGLQSANKQVSFGTWWLAWIPFFGAHQDVKTAKGFEKMRALNSETVEAQEKAFHEAMSANGTVPRANMLTSFMRHGLAGDELKTENLLQIVAASDTTAGLMRGAFLYVMTNPVVYRSLQAEIDSAVEAGQAPRTPAIITSAQVKKLRYLQAVIKESFRMFSPVDSPLPRQVPPMGDTVTIDGEEVYLPGGISVIPSFRAMHRNKSVYGEDADVDVFRPERWLEETDQTKLEAMKHEFDPGFGFGRGLDQDPFQTQDDEYILTFTLQWQCLGKKIALCEVEIVLFELFRLFDWTIVNPERPWKHTSLIGLHSISDMWVRVEERRQ